MKKQTEVIGFLQCVWDSCYKRRSFSWRNLNKCMGDALSLAIESGMTFDQTDFPTIATKFRFSWWAGVCFGSKIGEAYYAEAVQKRNASAMKSFEVWFDRKPFKWGGIYSRGDDRLYGGAKFKYQGMPLTVTSFASDGESLVACTNFDMITQTWTGKIQRRLTITREDLKVEKKRLVLSSEIVELIEEKKIRCRTLNKLILKTFPHFCWGDPLRAYRLPADFLTVPRAKKLLDVLKDLEQAKRFETGGE